MKNFWLLSLFFCVLLVWCWEIKDSQTTERQVADKKIELDMKQKCSQYDREIFNQIPDRYQPWWYWAIYDSERNTCLAYFRWCDWMEDYTCMNYVYDVFSHEKLVNCPYDEIYEYDPYEYRWAACDEQMFKYIPKSTFNIK